MAAFLAITVSVVYLNGVLTAIVDGHKQKDIDQLLP